MCVCMHNFIVVKMNGVNPNQSVGFLIYVLDCLSEYMFIIEPVHEISNNVV